MIRGIYKVFNKKLSNLSVETKFVVIFSSFILFRFPVLEPESKRGISLFYMGEGACLRGFQPCGRIFLSALSDSVISTPTRQWSQTVGKFLAIPYMHMYDMGTLHKNDLVSDPTLGQVNASQFRSQNRSVLFALLLEHLGRRRYFRIFQHSDSTSLIVLTQAFLRIIR